jgi:hypothetical protein
MSMNRRDFGRSLGLAALASLVKSKRADAAPPGKAKYLLIFYTNGTDPGVWSPKGSTANNIVFSPMTEVLAPLRGNLILAEKLSSNGTADNHAAPGGLTGQNFGAQKMISLDQFVADQIKAAGIITPIPSLMLGSVPTEEQRTFYRDNQKLTPIFSPTVAYDNIFNAAAGGLPAETVRRRKTTIGQLSSELETIGAGLSATEQRKLKLHVNSIKDIETRLANSGGTGNGVCDAGAKPAEPNQPLLAASICLDLAVAAFGCDITRVAAVQFGHDQNCQVNIPEVGPGGNYHNDFIHSDNPRTRLLNVERWLCGEFLRAANKLKALPAPDGNGTLFDQTIMFWAREMGDAILHNGSDMRFVFSGGAGGYLSKAPGGRYIDGGGDAHLRALLNVCQAMGITNFNGFGDPNGARTPLPAIGQ